MSAAAADTLLAETAAAIVVASLAGVGMQSGRRASVVLASLLAAGGAATLVVAGRIAMAQILVAQLPIVSATIALALVGRWCRRLFDNVLDAAATALAVTMLLAIGLLAAGPLAAALPTGLLNVLLGLNPFVAAASAAGVDLLRSEPFYRLSPIAHRQFAYPEWWFSLTLFAAVATASMAAAAFPFFRRSER